MKKKEEINIKLIMQVIWNEIFTKEDKNLTRKSKIVYHNMDI